MRLLHLPTFAALAGCVFCVSSTHYDLANAIRIYWAGCCLCFFTMATVLLSYLGHPMRLQKDKILKTFCLVGVLEILYAVLQVCGLVPDNYRYAYYSGSLNNPAIFGMLLSFCLPISVFYLRKSQAWDRPFWGVLNLLFALFIILSDSRTAIISSFCGVIVVCLTRIKAAVGHLGRWRYVLLLSGVCFMVAGWFMYQHKPESADGRLLIWSVCVEMIKEKPWTGWGINGFMSHYMNFQAKALSQDAASPVAMLADKTQNPFNEILHAAICFGIPCAIFFVALAVWALWQLRSSKTEYRDVYVGLMTVFFVWSLFSYPLAVPFVWILLLFIFLVLCEQTSFASIFRKCRLAVFLVSAICFYVIITNCFRDIKRILLQERATRNVDASVLDEYGRLYERYSDDGIFLYGYGVLLHRHRRYEESLKVMKLCSKYLADYDVMLVMGDDCQRLGQTDSALACYKHASAMIPNRFLPLYYQMKVYQEAGDEGNAIRIAKTIINKPVKIPSGVVTAVRMESEEFLESNQADSLDVGIIGDEVIK